MHAIYGSAPQVLSGEAERLRQFGVQVQHEVLDGVPDEMLVQAAGAEQARLIVVASLDSPQIVGRLKVLPEERIFLDLR